MSFGVDVNIRSAPQGGDVPTRGNLVPDVHLAAVLRQSGMATLCTHDRDFRKFAFLDERDPVAD